MPPPNLRHRMSNIERQMDTYGRGRAGDTPIQSGGRAGEFGSPSQQDRLYTGRNPFTTPYQPDFQGIDSLRRTPGRVSPHMDLQPHWLDQRVPHPNNPRLPYPLKEPEYINPILPYPLEEREYSPAVDLNDLPIPGVPDDLDLGEGFYRSDGEFVEAPLGGFDDRLDSIMSNFPTTYEGFSTGYPNTLDVRYPGDLGASGQGATNLPNEYDSSGLSQTWKRILEQTGSEELANQWLASQQA